MLTKAKAVNAKQALTIVLLTFERPDAGLATAQQWLGHCAQIIVMDGSANRNEDIATLGESLIYQHSVAAWTTRLAQASTMVKTLYVQLISDDDVFLPSGVQSCLTELGKNPELIAVSGVAVRSNSTNSAYCLQYPKSLGWDNVASEPKERLHFLASRYIPSAIYGVCRTEAFKASASSMALNPLPVFAYGELHHEFVINALGRVRVLPTVSWICRDVYAKAAHPERVRAGTTSRWFADEDSEYSDAFIEGVGRCLEQQTGRSRTLWHGEVRAALRSYAELVAQRDARARQRLKLLYVRFLPIWLRQTLRPVAVRIRFVSASYVTWPNLVRQLKEHQVDVPVDALDVLAERDILEREAAASVTRRD